MNRTSVTDWEAAGRSFEHRGHKIFVRTGGKPDAEPLVLIHGFPTASWDWEALWPELEKRYRLLTLDMIGFGFSAKPNGYNYSLVDQADIFERFLVSEGVHAYYALAHDYGDTVAQELLARQDDAGDRPRIQSVAFLNGGLFPEMHRPVLMQKLLVSPIGPLLARLSNRKTLAANMRKIFGPDTQPDDALIDAFWSLLSRNDGPAVMPKLLGYMAERRVHRERWVGALLHAKVPLTVIDGAADPISGAHMVERYKQLVPNPRVTLLERIGHYPQVEAPEAVLKAYLAFRS